MEIRNGSRIYLVSKKVGDSPKYRLFLCNADDSERSYLLQIAAEREFNGSLDRAAFMLRELKGSSDKLEAEYARVKTDPKDLLNYDFGFPELIDSFICEEQGSRRINILAFRKVDDASKMVPLASMVTKDRLRVDLRTSAWMMGKLLKILTFAHSEGFSVGCADGDNIIIEPDEHYVVLFDWSAALVHDRGEVPLETRTTEISAAAKAVIVALGGDPETGVIPDDGDEAFDRYTGHLLRLAGGTTSDAERAHRSFYELIDTLWERCFYPFCSKPITEISVTNKKEDDY